MTQFPSSVRFIHPNIGRPIFTVGAFRCGAFGYNGFFRSAVPAQSSRENSVPDINVAGVRLNYVDAGAGDPLFFLHGNAGSGQVWRKVIPTLSQHFRVIAHDRQGFGHSETTEEGDFSPFGYADELARLMDMLGIEKAHICGLSFGGMTAQAFALNHAHRVDRLILVGTMADRTGRDVKSTLETVEKDGWPVAAKSLAQSWFYDGSDPADIAEAYEICLQSSRRMRELTVKALGEFDIRDRIHQIAAPTLVLVGEEYKNTPIEFSEYLRDNIPGARMVTIANCGHLVPVDRPEQFCTLVLPFLLGEE